MTASGPGCVDELLTEDALVYGSLPPAGRDLDLLVRSGEAARLSVALVENGWTRRGRSFAAFGGGTAFAADVVALEDWSPSPAVAASLLEESVALPGYRHLRAPADHHRLLVLVRRWTRGMHLDDRRRTVVASFDVATWDAARAQAARWGLADPLERFADALTSGDDSPPASSALSRARALVPLHRGPRVVALSGLDGAGKSTHAELLRTALEALGYDVSIQWTKIARDEWLKKVARPIRSVVNALLARRLTAHAAADPRTVAGPTMAGPAEAVAGDEVETRNFPDGTPPPPDPAKLLRQRSRLLTVGWTFALAFANATTHRREVRRRGTRVVICDRYVLDTMAHLRYRYGFDRSFRWQGTVVRLLSPRAAAAFLLDVSPATARARKPEQYTTEDLTRLRQCYLDATARLPVTVVDVEQPMEEVAARIARQAWTRLST